MELMDFVITHPCPIRAARTGDGGIVTALEDLMPSLRRGTKIMIDLFFFEVSLSSPFGLYGEQNNTAQKTVVVAQHAVHHTVWSLHNAFRRTIRQHVYVGPTKLNAALAIFAPYLGNNSSSTSLPCRRLLRAYRSYKWCPLLDGNTADHTFRLHPAQVWQGY